MNVKMDIARRYLFGKKSTNAINLITGISIGGIAIGTAALILILSVFNGFRALLSDMFDAFNPDLKITLVEGKSWQVDSSMVQRLRALDGVKDLSLTLEEIALFEYDGTQKIGTIKGVDDRYQHVTAIDTTILSGKFELAANNINYGVVGLGINNMLGVNHRDGLTPITVYMLKRKQRGPLDKAFRSKTFYPSGVFSVRSESDNKYVIASLSFVNRLLNRQGHISSIEVQASPESSIDKVAASIATVMGSDFKISDRYEQNATFLKIMNIEKWVSYLITCFTLLLIAFNLIGALWMIALDKARDISILKSMGMTRSDIKGIFMRLGLLITGIGLMIGLLLALLIYWLQKNVGLIQIPDGYMTTAYPIELSITDFLVVPATVIVIGVLAVLLPSRVASKQSTSLH
jgi:lipoprotein-releasing system permease protein